MATSLQASQGMTEHTATSDAPSLRAYHIKAMNAQGHHHYRTYQATAPDEALAMAEREDSGRADYSYVIVADYRG